MSSSHFGTGEWDRLRSGQTDYRPRNGIASGSMTALDRSNLGSATSGTVHEIGAPLPDRLVPSMCKRYHAFLPNFLASDVRVIRETIQSGIHTSGYRGEWDRLRSGQTDYPTSGSGRLPPLHALQSTYFGKRIFFRPLAIRPLPLQSSHAT